MLEIVDFMIGFFIVLGCLFLVGITRGRKVSQKTWVILWSIASFALALFLVIAFVVEDVVFLSCALGGSLGYVIAVAVHTIRHL